MKKIVILISIFLAMTNIQATENQKGKDIAKHLEKIEKRKELNELMRKKHLELVNKLYDLKSSQIAELESLAKKAEGLGAEEQKIILADIKKKRSEFKKVIKNFHKDTMKKELKAYRKELYGDKSDRHD